MSLGEILLRPQVLNTAPPSEEARPLDAYLEFFSRLAREIEAGGTGLSAIEAELQASLHQLTAEVEPRIAAAKTRILALFEPLLTLVNDALNEATTPTGFEKTIETGQALTEALAKVLEGLTTPKIAQFLTTLFDIIETDLGLTEARFRQFFSETCDRIVTRLQTDYLNGSTDSAAYNRYALGSSLQEMRGLLNQDFDLPPLNKDTLLPPLIEKLQALGFDTKVSNVAEAVTRVNQALTPLSTLEQFFPRTAFGPSSLGAAETPKRTCWYASWLNNAIITETDCANSFHLAQVDFKRINASTMEDIAFHSKWIACLAEAGLHAASIERGDFVANLLNILWQGTEAGVAGFGNYAVPSWLKWVSVPTLTALGGLEGARFNDFFGLLLILTDLAETQLYARWIWLAREGLLSTLTLLNHDAERFDTFVRQAEREAVNETLKAELNRVKRIHNHNQIEGFAHVWGELGTLLIPLILSRSDRENYGFPNSSGGSWGRIVGYVFLDMAVGLAFTYTGGVVTRALSGSWPDGGRLARLFLKDRIFFGDATGEFSGWDFLKGIPALVTYLVDYFLYYYLFTDGNTDGKFSGRKDSSGNEIRYPGYPDRASSPYKLPWEKGKVYQCAQGNLGIWSHTPFSYRSELYAYDFSHNLGDEVLAIRGGVVWDYEESTPDGNHDLSANKIIILHDASPVSGHDFDQNGNPVRTFSEYLHGQNNGITAVLGSSVVKEKDSPGMGTRVQQGQAIMKADHTGRSAYNHLHLQVRPMDAATNRSADYTIPFVFSDSNLEGDKGVPKALNWYESDNEKVP